MDIKSKRARGVTLIELLVALAVLAVLMMVAVPGFSSVMKRQRVNAAVTQLRADLAYARAEAVSRSSFVSICASSTGDSCSESSDYSTGWIVYSYPVGAKGADQRYDASKAGAGFSLLRGTDAATGVSIHATDGDVISYGQQGQIKRDLTGGAFNFLICSFPPGAEQPENSSSVPGSDLQISGSGIVSASPLEADASCE
jgi:type IV fimbrial biogenesis protein FimT